MVTPFRTKTEELREKIIDVSPCPIPNNSDEGNCPRGVVYCKDCELAIVKANKILQAFNQWLEEQEASHWVKCPHCSYSQFADEEVVGMSPCNECNSTGYILEPLRLEAE